MDEAKTGPSKIDPSTSLESSARDIFASTFDMFGLLNEAGDVIEMNGRVFDLAGVDTRLLAGQRFSHTVYWQATENTATIVDKAIRNCLNGSCEKVALDFRISADRRRPLEIELVRLGSDDKPTIFIAGRMLPDKRAAEMAGAERAEHLLSAASNADIGLWYWDLEKDETFSTPRCNELFEVPTYQRLTFDGFLSVIHPEDREFVVDLFETSQRDGRRFREEFRVVYSDGRVDWILAEGRSVLGGEGRPIQMMSAVRKITEEKAALSELARATALEKKARDEAIEANRAKDFFLAFVSHEIRSSLNAIIGWSRILLTKEVDAATHRSALETIERSARNQNKLINDLVDSARVASGRIRLEYKPMDICEVVRGVVEAHRPAAESVGINYSFTADIDHLNIIADAARLQQVFGNLISNALKFTSTGGKIEVSLKTGAEAVTIDVSDNGAGIAASALPGVFRQFSQVESGNFGGNTGLGLGLSIVKILVERHGGHVRAESHGVGKGSKFSVTLPINTDIPISVDSSPNLIQIGTRPLEGLKILIVEDNTDSREVLQMFLEKSGAKAESAESAKAGYRLLTESTGRKPDVLISDLAMPDEDGYSFIGRVRHLPKAQGGEVPAIALSAFANEESRKRAFEAGFQRYATKPFDHDTLITDILKVVGKNDAGEQEGENM